MSGLASPDPARLEARVEAIETLIKDARKWGKIIGIVLLGFTGLGFSQIPGYIKETAQAKAKDIAASEAAIVAKETADRVVNKVTESEIKDQMEKFRKAAEESANLTKDFAKTAEVQVRDLEVTKKQLDELKKHGLSVVTSPPITFSLGVLNRTDTQSVDFEFPVKSAWYHVLARSGLSGDYSISLAIENQRVKVTATNNSTTVSGANFNAKIQVFASKN